MSYEKYWSLAKRPFGRPETADDFYPGRPQREAIARLDYLIRGGHGSGVMISPPGVGQSTLMRRIGESSGFGDCAVDIIRTTARQQSRDELLHQLAIRLGSARLISDAYRQVCERVTALGRQRVRTVWLVDGCTQTAAAAAGSLSTECPWMTVVLGCTADQALRIAAGLGGCSLRIDLEPFELSDTIGFVRHQLRVAGGDAEIFSDAAIVRLHELGEGRVARIARLAELTLPVGAAHQSRQITADVVEEVQHEVVSAAA
jgi:type II secretory pathway predicted ATPase ExeA